MASLSPLGIDEETIKAASIAAMEAHRNPRPYSVTPISSTVEIIAFGGSWSENDWVVSEGKDPWGLNDYPSIEKIPVELVKDSKNVLLQNLPSLRSVGNVEAAKVNAAFFNKFLSIKNDEYFSNQVDSFVEGRKKIIFTGHSGAGPIAIFATIWLLEKLKSNKNQPELPELPHCVTFGSPLAGNYILNHALRRERWADLFIHFVNRYDIVPRLFLATPSTTKSNLQQILNFFSVNRPFNSETNREFFETVLRNASCVASEAACSIMGSTNKLSETISSFVDLSPYRPFGTYVFCSGNGRFVVVKNADAVLQLLVFSSQLSSAEEGEAVARLSLEQHLSYRDEVSKLEKEYHIFKDFVIGEDREDDESGFINDVLKERALDNLGLSLRARLCILAAREWEKQKKLNQQKLESKTETMNQRMQKLEEYRATRGCRGGIGYYDGFKLQEQEDDFKANVTRLELAGIWDEILELLKKRPIQLPDEFEGDEKWIKMGTEYRRLVEPLDIANYYRHSKGKDSKEYLRPGSRPKRYFYTQRWLQHYEPMNELRGESTFWAVVEELKIKMTVKGFGFEEVETEIDELYKILDKWYHSKDVNIKDAFLPGSTLVKWWNTLTPSERKKFDINKIINSGLSC